MEDIELSGLAKGLRLDASFPEVGVTKHANIPWYQANRWTVVRDIGRGSFGTVTLEKCDRFYGPEFRAVKKIIGLKAYQIARELESMAKISEGRVS